MPVYEYKCNECGERTHRLQDMGEDSSGKRCLSCGTGVIKKVFSVFGSPSAPLGDSCAPTGRKRFT
jgi:putative FmdB family regulatory protein